MNTKRKLNCFVFSNLIVSLLSLNMLTNSTTTTLIKKTSDGELNKIYEKEITTTSVIDTIISSEPASNVITISNKVMQSQNKENTESYSYVKPSYNSLTGDNLVAYAKRYVGLPYISAGRSLATGTDCSGFTSLIYKEFGVTLGRTVASQLYSGTYVSKSDLMPGDLIFYSYGSVASHVTIYIGDGMIIHESNPRDGVKISTMNIMNYITARRIITLDVTSESPEFTDSSNIETERINEIPEIVDNTEIVDNSIIEETIVEETKVVEEIPQEETIQVVDEDLNVEEDKIEIEVVETVSKIDDETITLEEETIQDNN